MVHWGTHCILCTAGQLVDQGGRDSNLLGVEHRAAVEVGHRVAVGVGLGRTVLRPAGVLLAAAEELQGCGLQ